MLGVSATRRNLKKLISRLVEVRLLDKTAGGYEIHHYLEHNLSKETIKHDRDWDRFRSELYAIPGIIKALKSRDANRCRYCGSEVNWSDRRGPQGGLFSQVNPHEPISLENVVVSCRRCNILRYQQTIPPAPLPLLDPHETSSELVPNQLETSSHLVLRARASYPSHPVLEVRTHTRDADAPPEPPPAPPPKPPRTPTTTKAEKRHPGNAFDSTQAGFYVTNFLHEEFMAQLGSHADEAVLKAWYAEADARRQVERPAIGSIIGWWRDEFRKWLRAKEWTGAKSKRRGERPDAPPKRHASEWFECKHDPPCPNLPSLQEHKRLVEAERSGQPEAVKAVLEMHAKHWPVEARSGGKGGVLH